MSTPDMELVLTGEQEESFGWVFFWDHRKHVETGDLAYAIAGNSPFLVLRESGEVTSLGTAYPTEHYLEPYRRAEQESRGFERTRVERLVLMDHLVSSGDRERHFVLAEPVFLKAGAVVSVDGGVLIVEHPDGTATRHPGEEEMRCGGWEPLGSAIGRRVRTG